MSKKNARAGEFYSINTKRIRGHKGLIGRRHNDNIEVIVFTHSKYTRGRKNIRLQDNPQINDKEPSYVLRQKEFAKTSNLGKKHSNMKITNSIDKSIIRNIKKRS